MFSERGRAKKLTVAFHFQYANQAAWKCDECRKQRLEKKRNCGFVPLASVGEKAVWARGGAVTTECPRSYVSAESVAWLEEFHVWRMGSRADLREYAAKTVEAFAVLESELAKERDNGSR